MSTSHRESGMPPPRFSWEQFVATLSLRVARAQFESWFDRLHCGSFDDAEIRLVAPSIFIAEWVRNHYLEQIVDAARLVDGRVRACKIDVEADANARAQLVPLRVLRHSVPGQIRAIAAGAEAQGGIAPGDMPKVGGSQTHAERLDVPPAQPADALPPGNVQNMNGAAPLPMSSPLIARAHFDAVEKEPAPKAGAKAAHDATSHDATSQDATSHEPTSQDFVSGGDSAGTDQARDTSRFAPFDSGAVSSSGSALAHDGLPHEMNSASLEFFQNHSDFHLNDEYSFDNFVTGSCNELAAAAARAVADFPGGRYNPLFIHGASGLGKTHLLQAICHRVLRSPRPRRVLYLSCENFVNQFIQSVTNGDLEAFRYKYRKVDMLLIDDIQFLEGKSRTQEEFFHTFNTLYNSQRQIVLSSDRPPSAIETLQERLVSRFRWGMVTMVETPAVETRIAILRRKARLWGTELDSDVAQFLAESIDTNIRELEGAVTKVIAHAELVGRKVDLKAAAEALRDLLPSRAPVSVQEIIEVVAGEFQVQPKDLQSKRRIQSVVRPRQVGMYLSRKHTSMSLEEIGGFFGGRDHSTVLHSVRKIERLLPEDPKLAERVTRLASLFARH